MQDIVQFAEGEFRKHPGFFTAELMIFIAGADRKPFSMFDVQRVWRST